MGEADKLLMRLGDRPLLAHCLGVLASSPLIDAVQVVASRSNISAVEDIARDSALGKLAGVCLGGEARSQSVLRGLEAVESMRCDWALVHDGARPFLTEEIVRRGLEAAYTAGAAIAALSASDTVKICDGDLRIESTPPRDRVWLAQTPQIAPAALLLALHRRYEDRLAGFTDEASLLEAAGYPVVVFEGSRDNIKIATPRDLALAESMLRSLPVSEGEPGRT